MRLQVKELAFVFYPITDVARARKFYEGFLGLKVGTQFEFAPGQWWIEYDIAGQALAVSNGVPAPKSTNLMLEVASLDEAIAAARAAGVPIVGELTEFPPCRMCHIADPDGNEIGLHQRKANA
ncbi:MAG TPA: VOC family protein [Opitutus sp.]|nr:VOC family protein [Opitutus sp.]